MDLYLRRRGGGEKRLPRTRGDGPAARPAAVKSQSASPHTRGWTRRRSPSTLAPRGFPAHAGMDPRPRRGPAACPRLPRTRGDGPATHRRRSTRRRASPHTRGWTRWRRGDHPGDAGFPAHAGMDPRHWTRCRSCMRLPRTRGDGPVCCGAGPAGATASPHTRGWTLRQQRDDPAEPGFPAHAGMDPSARATTGVSPGLPRTRGDGPGRTTRRPRPSRASPHTRGWTLTSEDKRHAESGFPAHAGMDPDLPYRAPPAARLPRTRGDGPVADRLFGERLQASPHTRGWTPRPQAPLRARCGFPAHAGMDPPRPPADAARSRLPRTRGDGPKCQAACDDSVRASPHTRGWTPADVVVSVLEAGFPAHAGMDLPSARSRRPSERLPRTRGDGPSTSPRSQPATRASPHTRGWTVRAGAERRPPWGFPAHAGMDPRPRTPRRRAARLPRTRGDGPADSGRGRDGEAASPHTRGWTRERLQRRQPALGFPAHAGMDPGRPDRAGSPRRLPRTRGDGPASATPGTPSARASPHTRGWTARGPARRRRGRGFPAHAGMDPPSTPCTLGRSGLPRTRGDGPGWEDDARAGWQASPHTRGWTPRRREGALPGVGFPAHAGMDPSTAGWRATRRRLPRTRGDGPSTSSMSSPSRAASPHTRGWTLFRPAPRGAIRGFPAHAGMDPRWDEPDVVGLRLPRTRGDGPAA